MSQNQKLTIGLFGFGVVGEGLYKIINTTPSLHASIKKICIKDATKKRNAPNELFTTDKQELLNDSEINVIVEAISDSKAGFEIISTAFNNGKSVVSSSKKAIAENLSTLLNLQKQHNTTLLYEAAACASIPIIRNLEEYYDNDLLHSFSAIVNGSTNYILTKLFTEDLSYEEALQNAQELGFAEADPTLDVNGYDALYKTIILLLHAFGIVKKPNEILFNGIQNLKTSDILFAKENGFKIKLIAQAKKLNNNQITCFLLPQFIEPSNNLYNTNNEYNGVIIESSFSDKQFFYGKGAGSFPTASAILSDLSALRYNYKYEFKKLHNATNYTFQGDVILKVYLSFTNKEFVNVDAFHSIEEWHNGYLLGQISTQQLMENDWWKLNGNSLITLPNAIIDFENQQPLLETIEAI